MKKEPDYFAVSRVWDEGVACADCMHCHTRKEPRPYGEGSVYETFRECDILDELADGDCPGLETEEEDQ